MADEQEQLGSEPAETESTVSVPKNRAAITNWAETAIRPAKMKRYRDWPAYPIFLNDCKQAALTDILVTPPVAAAILGYSRVRMTRLLDQEEIVSWAWYEPNTFHPLEVFVSVRSLVNFGLHRGRLGSYENEVPLRSVVDRAEYEKMQQELVT